MSVMLDSLKETRAGKKADLEALLAGEPSVEALASVEERNTEIAALDSQIESVESAEARSIVEAKVEARVGFGATVVNEERTYTEHGSQSYFRDLVHAQTRNDRGAWDRLYRHAQEEVVESRAISNTDGAGGELTPPAWLISLTALTPRPARVVSNQLMKMALPSGTDHLYVPRVTTGTLVASQNGDNAATTTQDLVTTSADAPVRTLSGYVDASIQLLEQSPLAGGIDQLIFNDLMRAYDLNLEQQVINGVGTAGQLAGILGAGTAITYTSGTPTAAGLYAAIGQGISKVSENRYDDVEAIAMRPATWYWLASQTDSNGRPFVVPNGGAPFNAGGVQDAPVAQSSVGTIHGVPVVLSAAIPNNLGGGTNETRVLIARFSDSVLFEGGVKTRVLPEVGSATLTVRLQAYGYAALAHRFPQSLAFVSGTGVIAPTGY